MKDKHCEEGWKTAGGLFLLVGAFVCGLTLLVGGIWGAAAALTVFAIGMGANICALPFTYMGFTALDRWINS
jgi:hypothetical protein